MNQKLIAIGKSRKNSLGFVLMKTMVIDLHHPKSVEEIQKLVGMKCFMVLIPEEGVELPDPLELIYPNADLPAGQIFSVGHEDVEFINVVQFLTKIDHMEEKEKGLSIVGENMRDCAYAAEDNNLNNVFTSRCSYTFYGNEHHAVEDVVAIGYDELGFYLKTEQGTYKYELSSLEEEQM